MHRLSNTRFVHYVKIRQTSASLHGSNRIRFPLINSQRSMIHRILSSSDRIAKSQQPEDKTPGFDNAGWVIRLANENGYLSWCRNTYIGTILGTSFLVQNNTLPYAGEVATLFIAMAGLNLMSGTGVFMYNVLKLREKMAMSRLTATYNLSMAGVHFILWCVGATVCLGFASLAEEKQLELLDEEEKPT